MGSQARPAERPAERGHADAWLRVYLGYAPGVGKTYAMLAEGRRRRARGTDVVVGWVETYGRAGTIDALDGLEIVPPQQIDYRGARVAEMDLDAVLDRRPQVVLVDELAHTNVPGARNRKRYQDVIELRAAGISVVGTLNVQHLASLRETVRLITGVDAGESVPDWVVDTADEVEMIDQSPEALRKRLRHGNVHPKERVGAALDGFYRTGNLVALRELTLRRMAEHASAHRPPRPDEAAAPRPADTAPAAASLRPRETVLVCLPPDEQAQQLVRRGVHLASWLGARLVVLHVTRPGGGLAHGGSLSNQEVTRALQLARELGGEAVTVPSARVADAIARHAVEVGATHIVVGESTRSRLRELLQGSIIRDVLRQARHADVHIAARAEP